MTTTAAAKIESLHATLVAAEADRTFRGIDVADRAHPVNVAYRAWKRAVNRAEKMAA